MSFFWRVPEETHLKHHKRLGPHLPDPNLIMKLGPDVEKVKMLFRAKENGWLEDEISFWDTYFSLVMLASGRVLPFLP